MTALEQGARVGGIGAERLGNIPCARVRAWADVDHRDPER
jgi:hypothetical protein